MKISILIHTNPKALAACAYLIDRSAPFEIEPWPDGIWRIIVKDEHDTPDLRFAIKEASR